MGADEALIPHLTSVNVACGFHAGDPTVMDRTVGLAARAGVAVGAHPGHPDLRGFGRRVIQAPPDEIERDVLYQVGALGAFAAAHGVRLTHVKPHGALYNQAAEDEQVAAAIARGVARAGRDLVLVGLATTDLMRQAARREGLRFAGEAFADRRYQPDGTLQSRRVQGAVITDPVEAAAQAVSIARDGLVRAIDGASLRLDAETLCLHGDNPAAVGLATALRRALEDAGVAVRPLSG